MPVVTIRGQMGSGAPEIGRLVAQHIQGDYVDREIIEEVATRLETPRTEVVAKEEPPGSLASRILEALARGQALGTGEFLFSLPAYQLPLNDARYLEGLKAVIQDLARSPSIVIRGRGSQFILRDHPRAIHVLVVAPLNVRIQRIAETMKLEEEAAKKETDKVDGSRRVFTKRYFGAEFEDPVHYDLIVNTGRLSFESATRLIVETITLVH